MAVVSEGYLSRLAEWANVEAAKAGGFRAFAYKLSKLGDDTISDLAVRKWAQKGVGADGLRGKSLQMIAAYRGETPIQTLIWLEGEEGSYDRARAFIESGPLTQVAQLVALGQQRLSTSELLRNVTKSADNSSVETYGYDMNFQSLQDCLQFFQVRYSNRMPEFLRRCSSSLRPGQDGYISPQRWEELLRNPKQTTEEEAESIVFGIQGMEDHLDVPEQITISYDDFLALRDRADPPPSPNGKPNKTPARPKV